MRDLYTKAGEALLAGDSTPWQAYPRPRMRRADWVNLNGWWDFAVTSDNRPPLRYDRKIRVPFVPESLLSGVHEAVPDGSFLWYRRELAAVLEGRALLHIGAADQDTVVWIGGQRAPIVQGRSRSGYSHEGGYEPFTADLTEALRQGPGELVIQVHDQLGGYKMPYGKQSLTRGGMWYTPCSGIWQTVWMETVPETYIQNVRSAPRLETDGSWTVTVTAEGVSDGFVEWEGGREPLREGRAVLAVREPELWSPEHPHLYSFAVLSGADQVESYFALRTLGTETVQGVPRLMLNGKPYFFNGLLDQGYWPDGLFTPADPSCFEEEILKCKALGFNMLRKHIKTEPEIFYYMCDRLGMAVFQDMVQNGVYSFFRDTGLPTVGLLRLHSRKWHTDAETRENFIEGMLSTVRQLKEHPSVVCWTIFNEGWGQFSGTEMYMQLKKEDPTRIIDTASGWFHPRGLVTDVESRHVYFRKIRVPRSRKPFILSEFGGYAWQPPEHAYNPDQVYGYRKFADQASLEEAVVSLYRDRILPLVKKGLCAAVLTQVSDVEDETNGLFSYDRKVEKIRPEVLRPVMEEMYK